MADFRASLDDPALSAYLHSAQINRASNRLGELFDKNGPTLTAITPMSGSKLAPTVPVQFIVAKPSGLASMVIEASYDGSNTRELIWDSAHGFTGFYLGVANTCVIVSSGGVGQSYTFNILRDGGWPANVTITVFATDTFGNSIHP